MSRDHPRMRGDKPLYPLSTPAQQGSPPHARGQVGLSADLPVLVGITPACAGTSDFQRQALEFVRDHPRMRGDKPNRLVWDHWKEGSPPHARGQVRLLPSRIFGIGITPACAGTR